AVETSSLVLAAGADAPHLSRRQRVAPNLIFALEFWNHHKLFDSIGTERITELRVAKLRGTNPFLLFLDMSAALQGQADGPFQVLVRHCFVRGWVKQLEQSTYGFVDG